MAKVCYGLIAALVVFGAGYVAGLDNFQNTHKSFILTQCLKMQDQGTLAKIDICRNNPETCSTLYKQ